MKDEIMKIVMAVVIIEVLLLTVGSVFAMLGLFGFNTGCVYRYDMHGSGSDFISRTISIRADGNDSSAIATIDGIRTIVTDPTRYGQWKRAGFNLAAGQVVDVNVSGTVSLCKSYLPAYNIGSNSNVDKNHNRIEIPRVSDNTPLTLAFDAKTPGWRNLLQAYPGDIVEVIVSDNPSSTSMSGGISLVTSPNIFTGGVIQADCSEGKQQYSPICGRWSLWNGSPSQYVVSGCTKVPVSQMYDGGDTFKCSNPPSPPSGTNCSPGCNVHSAYNAGDARYYDWCRWCVCYKANTITLPIAYKEDGSLTSAALDVASVMSFLTASTTNVCDSASNAAAEKDDSAWNDGSTSASGDALIKNYDTTFKATKYWFSARDVGGLLTRNSSSPVNGLDMSGGGAYAAIMNPAVEFTHNQYTGRKIMSKQYGANDTVGYLQYKFASDASDTTGASYANHTGGYVLQVKHTKCYRKNGSAIGDIGYTTTDPKTHASTVVPRGQILYVVSNRDPNTDGNIASKAVALHTDTNGKVNGGITVPNDTNGDLWFKIDNNPNDYQDSQGSYLLALSYSQSHGAFTSKVLTPLINVIKNRINTAGMEMFQNLICYNQQPNGSCTNFFNYIRAMLTLYIMTYGMMFMTGMVKASYQDVVIRVVKIGIVAGLISGDTFVWFHDNVFNFIINFTDQIIANFGGFHNISSVNTSGSLAIDYTGASDISGSGPFMFLDTLFTKMFFSQTFTVQLLAIMGIGLIGILYFIIIGVGIVIMLIVGFRAIAVYIIAMIATAFLISLTPIFLTFMLFEQTYYMFENWYKALFRYMMEPVIMMIGVIVLVQIFTLYLDNVLSYSACWKCAIPFYIPFANLVPLPGLQNIPLLCINWFAPWGLDNTGASGQLGMDLAAMLGLVIIAFTMYGYADLAQQMASQLTSAGGNAPSSIGAGTAMAQSMGQSALKRVGLDDQTREAAKQQKEQQQQRKQAAASRSKPNNPK